MRAGIAGRWALFVLVTTALVAGATLVVADDQQSRGPSSRPVERPPLVTPPVLGMESSSRRPRHGIAVVPGREDAPHGRHGIVTLEAGRRVVAAAARRFLNAFLTYEVGPLTPDVVVALRSASTEEFAGQLLAAPPRPSAAPRPRLPATLEGLEVVFLAGPAAEAQVSGTLRRGTSVEGFSFIFERRGERWLASGVGE